MQSAVTVTAPSYGQTLKGEHMSESCDTTRAGVLGGQRAGHDRQSRGDSPAFWRRQGWVCQRFTERFVVNHLHEALEQSLARGG